MIVVEPYVSDAVASVSELATPALQQTAVQQICVTLVQMLVNHIVTIDVQPLISQTTGHVIFIDMTEAVRLHPSNDDDVLDQSLMGSFCAEMLALIPHEWTSLAARAVRSEIDRLRQENGSTLSPAAQEILYSQTLLFPDHS